MKNEFENVICENYAYRSQFVASWVKAGGRLDSYTAKEQFKTWLRNLGIPNDVCLEIYQFATCGKLELQESAKKFLKPKEES